MPAIKNKYKKIVLLSSITVTVYGAYVLYYGWGLKNGVFDSEITGELPIAIDSAYCFILMGLAMVCLNSKSKNSIRFGQGLVICTFAWSALMLVRDFTTIPVPLVFGMSPQTALCFICMSVALFFAKRKAARNFVQGLLHFVTITASVAIIGYLFRIPEFYRFSFIPMAIYTAIGFFILSLSGSLFNPTTGITGLFTGKMIGNIMARRLFAKMLAAILIIGFLRIIAHRELWVSPELGTAILIVVFLIISLALIWTTSRTLNRIDTTRRTAVENFRIAVESAPYALVISDSDGKILSVNQQTEVLYGYTKKNLIGKPVRKVIPTKMHNDYERRKEEFFARGEVVRMGGDEDDEMLALRKDGTEFPIEIILVPIEAPMGTISLSSIVDITQRRSQQAIIKKQLIELQAKNEELEQFNYISSHDLQEPLRTVSNYIEMLEEDYGEQLSDEVKIHLFEMQAAIMRMSKMVRSLLEFGKLGHKKKLVNTDVELLLHTVVADLKNLITQSGAKVKIECGPRELYTYETELRQLFQNLISNAIKFQRPGVLPEVSISCSEIDGFFEFSISDNGIGIKPEHHDKIFRIFHRLNTDEEYEGHGIGLANCKKIAEMHGGRIWAESIPGEGSTFKFTILKFIYEGDKMHHAH